ncbi:hypothetical protein K0M31_009988 [Melipona bicolor]|uniref:Uncharacterized protein n=1 Tax=Melipona bicolor TaxID=60889 RepID=A0AA40KIL8_9HYME|nr:hypothetical protein K0M31_009988 [Melipona bicolor]
MHLPKGRSVCCDLSLRGPKHAQQRTTPQDRGVLLVSREEGTIFAPYPLSNAGSLLQLLDAMHSPQKAEMISSLERCGVFLISLRRKSSQS